MTDKAAQFSNRPFKPEENGGHPFIPSVGREEEHYPAVDHARHEVTKITKNLHVPEGPFAEKPLARLSEPRSDLEQADQQEISQASTDRSLAVEEKPRSDTADALTRLNEEFESEREE